jgi:hypothetical protein
LVLFSLFLQEIISKRHVAPAGILDFDGRQGKNSGSESAATPLPHAA